MIVAIISGVVGLVVGAVSVGSYTVGYYPWQEGYYESFQSGLKEPYRFHPKGWKKQS